MDYTYVSPKAELRKSHTEGEGIYAKESIAREEIIIIFGGVIQKIDIILENAKKGVWSQDKKNIWNYFIQIEKDFAIGPPDDSSIGAGYKVNHSCEPNSYISGQVTLKAMRDIEPNEEITFDYAIMNYLPIQDKMSVQCKCGSKNCRGELTSEDWKKKELQKKYNGYFSSFLQEVIEENKH